MILRLPRASRRSRGFTLVELMIVLVIASIMTLLMLPEMRGTYEEALLRANARKIANAFRSAYSSAVITHRQHRVRIDPSNAALVVESRNSEGEIPFTPLKEFEREMSQLHKTIALRFHPPKPAFTGETDGPQAPLPTTSSGQDLPEGTFLFHADGTCEGQDIEIRDRMGFGLLIHLNPVTSRVRFDPLERIPR
jgi:prepilin-type N-terminal cleavage/methylation domain-containing protein